MIKLLPFALYLAVAIARADLRIEIVLATTLALALFAKARGLFDALYPVGLVGLLYDAMRPLQKLGLSPERVHVCDLRELESRLFGWESLGVRYTLHDWFRVHHAPIVDVFAAIPYGTFIFVSIACAVVLAYRDRPAMRRFTWAFFALNVAGFTTYHLLPAAPPWYFHAHGCAVDLATRASEGPALARVDALLGITYFHGMYAKASSVFGALPSLHCAYPLLVVVEGWRSFGPKLRAAAVAYWLAMVFAAVYLDHHWVLDAVLGSAYALIAALVLRRLIPPAPRAAITQEPSMATAEAAE